MDILRHVRGWHRPLVVHTAVMLALVVVCGVGLLVDDRTVMGESVWLKPMKFAFAFGVYSVTLAWLLSKVVRPLRFGWWAGTIFALVGAVEVAAITLAGARGTFSHFNTSHDAINEVSQPLFFYGVLVLFAANLVIAIIALFRRVGDPALSWAIRCGLVLSAVGMTLGFALIDHRHRVVTDAYGHRVELFAGHTIGGPDGHGIPLAHWSAVGGDLRVPHFFGLHGIHVMLGVVLLVTLLGRRREWLRHTGTRVWIVAVAAVGYAGFLSVITWQAVRGQSLIHPDAATWAGLGAVTLVTAAGLAAVIAVSRRRVAAEEPRPSLVGVDLGIAGG
ncbi:MAG TPA: hypothetical protein VE172_17255 [Stackebrandtia sp.]|jgi:hypothetical protein|uniref:hypothetical protein n=1 Tax=Stackebrandtia sp. TaxID=2023065 RepID=UPI002D4B3AE8|nr:hypothetical protein [Stackebrandtia sp.]HZE40552.1 hypothetical protein [Stackebrandtia sp.]